MKAVIDKASSNFYFLSMAGIFQFAFYGVFQRQAEKLETDFGAKPPDMRFGYSADELYGIFDTWGEEGCNEYIRTATYDFMYIPTYVVFLNALLIRTCRRNRWSDSFVPQLAWTMLLADYGETFIHVMGCREYPDRLDKTVVMFGDLFNRIKFVGVGVAGTLILAGVVIGSYTWPFMMMNQRGGGKTVAAPAKTTSSAKSGKKA